LALNQNSVFLRVTSFVGAADFKRIWMVIPVEAGAGVSEVSERATEKYFTETRG
jgi:hypothetical protein